MILDPDDVETTYTYDAQDRLETATTPQGVTTYRYWPDGLQKGTSHLNGLEEARCYDAAGRVTAIVTAKTAIAESCANPAQMVSRFEYAHDANGNRTRQLERRTDPLSQLLGAAEETRYGYDAQDRLVAVAYPDDTAVLYRLDAVGNRTGERRAPASRVAALTVAAFAALAPADALADLTATFNRADWLVSQVDAKDATRNATYEWDLAGNLSRKQKGALDRSFRWTYRNTLTAVLDGGVEVGRYDYDQDLQRVKRTTAQEEVEYVLDDRHVLQEASASAGHPSYRRYHYAMGPLAVVDAAGARAISTDALGSPTDLTGAGGTVASMRKYDAWGQYRDGTAPAAGEAKLGFTGHQFDPETGLVYARARYYDAEMGRFISRDAYEGALGDAPSLHRFAYAHGNPLFYVDEEGNAAADAAEGWEAWQREHAYTGELILEQTAQVNSDAVVAWAAEQARGGGWLKQAAFGVVGVTGAVANEVAFGIFATLADPGMVVRSIMRIGAGAGEGAVDVQEGRSLEGAGKIIGDVSAAILTVEGGARVATAPMRAARAAETHTRQAIARERIVETIREAKAERGAETVARMSERPPGAPRAPAAIAADVPVRVLERPAEVLQALEAAKAERGAVSPQIAARLRQQAANEPGFALGMEGTPRPPGLRPPSSAGSGITTHPAHPNVRPPIIVGENMARVQEYASRVGGHAYRPWSNDPFDYSTAMRRNQRWIRDQIRAGREVVDIGPDFARRAATGRSSMFYEMERRSLRGYSKHRKVFRRTGNTGGVPGLDF